MMQRVFQIVAVICAVLVILIYVYNVKIEETKNMTHCNRTCSKSAVPYVPKTGDIVLMQSRSHNMFTIEGMEGVPAHAGIVWVRGNDILVVENTPFADNIKDIVFGRSSVTHPKGGVRVVLLSELLRTSNGFLSIRRLLGKIDNKEFEKNVYGWSQDVTFDHRIGKMKFIVRAGLVLRHSFPKFSEWLLRLGGLSSASRREMFCSEYLLRLLQKLGHVDPRFSKAYAFTPIHLSSATKLIDVLSSASPSPLHWDEDMPILCPELVKSVIPFH